MTQRVDVAELNQWLGKRDWKAVLGYLKSLDESGYQGQEFMARGLLIAFGPPELRNLKGAIESLNAAIRLEPKEPRYLQILSEILLLARKPDLALRAAEGAVGLDTKNIMSQVAAGRAAKVLGQCKTALKHYKSASNLVSSDQAVLKADIDTQMYRLAEFWWEPLKGKRLQLSRTSKKHESFLLACRTNKLFQEHYNLFQNITEEAVLKDIIKASNVSPVENKKIEWVIERKGEFIGIAGLVDMDLRNLRAEIQVGLPESRGYGEALEATLLVLEFAFSTVGLKKIISYVYSDNTDGQVNTEHLGFKQEGLLRSHVLKKRTGERLDLYVYGCLDDDYYSNERMKKFSQRFIDRNGRR